jgi:hypothetical protein
MGETFRLGPFTYVHPVRDDLVRRNHIASIQGTGTRRRKTGVVE